MGEAPAIAALNGFAVSAALIFAIGPQNALVLRQGLMRRFAGRIATVCFVSIGSLMVVGVAGSAALFSLSPLVKDAMFWFGIVFIVGYGAWSFGNAFRGGALTKTALEEPSGINSSRTAVLTALAFCWLNPHSYLDTLVLIGGISAQYGEQISRVSFGAGAITAAGIWFYGLAYGAGRIAPLFESPKAWRVLDIVIALLMWSIAAGLILREA